MMRVPVIFWGRASGEIHALVLIPGASSLKGLCGVRPFQHEVETVHQDALAYLNPCEGCRDTLLAAFGIDR